MSAQTAPTWTQQHPSTSPSARSFPAMAYDSGHRETVLFGGRLNGTAFEFNETWVWDGFNWTDKTNGVSPSPRENHAMTYDSARGHTVLFGGNVANGFAGDTWVWDGFKWSRQSPALSPPARADHAMAYDSANGQIMLFGGFKGDYLNDTWVWDGVTWTRKSPRKSPPS